MKKWIPLFLLLAAAPLGSALTSAPLEARLDEYIGAYARAMARKWLEKNP